MTVTHPVALRDGGAVPSAYTYGSSSYPIDSDGTIECPAELAEEIAAALADHYGADADGLLGGGGGTCDVVKSDGDVCGRERPCQYHSEG